MPRMMTIEANPNYQPETPEQRAAWAAAKAGGRKTVAYVTAMENIRQSGGLYVPIMPDEAEVQAAPRRLEDYSMEELKLTGINLGIKTEKRMKKADWIALIRRKLDEVDVGDEDEDE